MQAHPLGIAAICAIAAAPAAARTTCLDRDRLVATLSDGYDEELVGRGMRDTRSMFEIYRSENGATWTIVQTFPDGTSCVMAAGEVWQDTSAEAFQPAEIDS